MMHPDNLAEAVDPQRLSAVLSSVHAQVAAAMWLSAGMICAFGAVACIALRWRVAALALGFCYSLTLCFLSNGYAQLIGPAGCAFAIAGLLWPSERKAPARLGGVQRNPK